MKPNDRTGKAAAEARAAATTAVRPDHDAANGLSDTAITATSQKGEGGPRLRTHFSLREFGIRLGWG